MQNKNLSVPEEKKLIPLNPNFPVNVFLQNDNSLHPCTRSQ